MENQRLEYQLIQKERINMGDSMMVWRTVVIPLSVTLVGVLTGFSNQLWVIGWFLGMLLLIYWRFMERHIDEQIKELYPRIVTLECQLNMTFFSHYIWHNLKKETRVPEFLNNGIYNYKGINDNIDKIGSRGHVFNDWFLLIYYLLGLSALVILLCSGYYRWYQYWMWISIIAVVLPCIFLFSFGFVRKFGQ